MMRKKLISALIVLALAFSFIASTTSTANGNGKGSGNGNLDPFSMQVIALAGEVGTDVYIKVSNELEGYELPNELKKVQLKYIVNGETITHNVKGIALSNGLYEVASLTDLFAYEELHAKIHIDDDQTGVKKVLKGSTTVLLRPDVEVGEIEVPEGIKAGETFNISFQVSEINGDIGGSTLVSVMHGENLLYSTIVQVPKGEGVNVTIPLTFGDPGMYDLTVTASDLYNEDLAVNIADYDTTNNINTKTIEVLSSTEPIFFKAMYSYIEMDYVAHDHSDYIQEFFYIKFYDNASSFDGGDAFDLTRGSLQVKVEADTGFSKEWQFDLSELAAFAQETGASHYVVDNNYVWNKIYYFEDYNDINTGEWIQQRYIYNNFFTFYGEESSVHFQYWVDDLDTADSIYIEAKLTNENGDTWSIAKDIILDATETYYFEGYHYLGYYYYKAKWYKVTGLTL
ncbi:hypothetical protein CIB95_04055 [Lottiidibacillus patelloidae]|uniref:CARDB domain-containing protein n=1 Tax=Lottiidibacillus patelloidae TaxID=2670334 RepID=A0A263BUX8_9BACI|nr:hypothetical protein [Lottiidibacillus patelloidae]OZM57553.1 hypothetical protein CIB95_04055 [Lottiidibacillus patelloidae]